MAMDYADYLVGLGLDRGTTIHNYTRALERYLTWCAHNGISPTEITATAMAEWADTLPETSASRRRYSVAVRHYLQFHGRTNPLDDPTRAIRAPKRRAMKWNGLEPEDAAAVVAAARGVYPAGTATLCGLWLGLRRFEIAKMEWTRFAPDWSQYTVLGKGNLIADLPVLDDLRAELEPHVSVFRYVFPGKRVAHVTNTTVSNWVREIGAAAGVPTLAPHQLRHTFIGSINDATNDLRAAQELARHASPDTTAGYTRVTKQRKHDAAAAGAGLYMRRLRAVGE